MTHPAAALPAIPTIFAIDVEPDDRLDPPGSGVALDGFQRTFDWLSELRPRLEAATGRPVAFAWFLRMDPQIEWLAGRADGLARAARGQLDAARRAGDELGLHTHAGRWLDGEWLADLGDAAWVERCLDVSVAAYQAEFGSPALSHRFGDRWSSPAMFDALARLGIRVDLTIEPGKAGGERTELTGPTSGSFPSYLGAPRQATLHRDGPLWLLPLTSADPGPSMPLLKRVARRLRYAGQPLDRPIQLDRAWARPADMWDLAARRLAAMDQPYLAFAIRSDIPLRARFERTRATLEALIQHPLAGRLQFMGAAIAADLLAGEVVAPVALQVAGNGELAVAGQA